MDSLPLLPVPGAIEAAFWSCITGPPPLDALRRALPSPAASEPPVPPMSHSEPLQATSTPRPYRNLRSASHQCHHCLDCRHRRRPSVALFDWLAPELTTSGRRNGVAFALRRLAIGDWAEGCGVMPHTTPPARPGHPVPSAAPGSLPPKGEGGFRVPHAPFRPCPGYSNPSYLNHMPSCWFRAAPVAQWLLLSHSALRGPRSSPTLATRPRSVPSSKLHRLSPRCKNEYGPAPESFFCFFLHLGYVGDTPRPR